MFFNHKDIDFSGKLPVRFKISYACAALADGAMLGAFIPFLMPYLTNYVLMVPATVGVLMAIGRIWDAVTDPIMGIITDRTKTRFGRRRPWFIVGAIPLALSWIAVWNVPSDRGLLTTLYVLAALLIFQTARTIFMIPYLALSAELTTDYHERSSVQAYRASFYVAGGMFGSCFMNFSRMFANIRVGFNVVAVITALVCLAAYVTTFLGVQENPELQKKRQPSFWASFSYIIKNRPYLMLCLYFIMTITAFSFTGGFLFYVIEDWLKRPGWLAALLITRQVSTLLWIPVLQRVSRAIGKKPATVAALAVGATIQASAYLLFHPSAAWLAFGWCGLIGVLGAASQLFPFSLAAETVDLDELETGHRKEGVYYSFLTFLMKCDSAVGVILTGVLLGASGYVANQQQTLDTLFRLRFFFSVVPGIILLLSAIVFGLFFSINTETANEIRRRLNARKAEQETAAS
jgi:GPH family glycoside/pentoside/hexuronide:cation symporter